MKAMAIKSFGDSGVFYETNWSKPDLKPGHVLVKIHASGVNPVDTLIREIGADLPFAPALPGILGMDFAGVVEEVADDISNFVPGDEVYGCAGGLGDLQGALAEFMLVDANLMAHKPKTLSMKEAAALPLVGITAYEGLTRAGLKAGQTLLVHGGSGGVGHIAIQIGKALGGAVYSTGGGAAQIEMIETLGATGINYRSESVEDYVSKHTASDGFDVIFDSVGGLNLTHSFNAIKRNGHIATTVSLAEVDLSPMHFKGASLHVVFMLIPMIYHEGRNAHGAILKTLANMADAGQLRPVLDQSEFSFQEIGAAHDHLTSGKAMGKIVVTQTL